MPTTPTAQNFVQVGSRTAADLAAMNKALEYLSANSPRAASILADMIEQGVRVSINHTGDLSFHNGVLNWDPNTGITTVANDGVGGGGVVSPALVLIHEGAHAVDSSLTAEQKEHNQQWDNDAERYAGQVEADVALELGEEVRGNHMGAKVLVPDVTQHTEANPDGTHTWVERDANGNAIIGPQYSPSAPAPTIPVPSTSGGPHGTNGAGDGGGSGGGAEGGDTESGDDSGDDEGGDAWDGPYDGGGGGDDNSGCVSIESFLPDGRQAGSIRVGDAMQLADHASLEKGSGEVSYSQIKRAQGFRITTAGGASLVCSDTAPIPTKESGLQIPANLLGHQVAVRWDEGGEEFIAWEDVLSVEHVGVIHVQHITVGNKCFWAGEKQGAYILHHNDKEVGGDEEFPEPDPTDAGLHAGRGMGLQSQPADHLAVDHVNIDIQLVGLAPPIIDQGFGA